MGIQRFEMYYKIVIYLQYIEAADLENATKETNPVQYHEAWQQLCKSE